MAEREKEPLALVRSTVVDTIPPHVELLSIFASARGKSNPTAAFVSSLVHRALEDISEKARGLGADAVVSLRIDVTHLGWGRVLVHVYGMAVRLR